ncbi:MAG TPA: hypothetical protein PLB62_06830, partial [Candidatus Sumerlaeota bacterium]|nr:hypothetical protein [Candidatus Sumerlaeota bacterium]
AEDVLYDPEAGGVAYTLKTPSRVLLRAGLRDGPLLKTLINWAPRPAGTHREPWDGKDESGVVDAAKMNGFMIICRAAALPENSIIVTASSSPDSQSAGRDIQTDDRRKAVIAALSSRDKAIEPAAWLPRKNIRTPVFSLSAGNTAASESEAAEPPIPVLSGEAGLVVSLDAGTRTMMLEQRYEIILFVDGEMMGEVEQGYSPYTWVLDTTEFPDGEHLITVNVAGLNDQIGTQSMKIVISNGSSDK